MTTVFIVLSFLSLRYTIYNFKTAEIQIPLTPFLKGELTAALLISFACFWIIIGIRNLSDTNWADIKKGSLATAFFFIWFLLFYRHLAFADHHFVCHHLVDVHAGGERTALDQDRVVDGLLSAYELAYHIIDTHLVC
jgi:hypothetical protein